MSRNEREQRDWLDRELDQLAGRAASTRSGAEPEGAYGLAATARHLNDLSAQQRQTPDEQFVRRLERELMPSRDLSLASHRWGAMTAPEHSYGKRLPVRSRRRVQLTFLSAALSTALLLAVVGVTAFVVLRGGTQDDSHPTMAAVVPLATPEPTAEMSELPEGFDWQRLPPAFESATFGGLAVANGTVYRLITYDAFIGSESFEGVAALNAGDGTEAWRLPTSWVRATILADESGVYFVAQPDSLVSVDPRTGAILWDAAFSRPVVGTALRDGVVYVWDESNTMTAIDVANGEAIWQTPTDNQGEQQSAADGLAAPEVRPTIGETVVAMISADGTLYVFDRASGEVAWEQAGFDQLYSRLTITDDVLFVLTDPDPRSGESPSLDGIGIDLDDGAVKWEITVAGPLIQPVAPGGTEQFHLIADSVTSIKTGATATRTPMVDLALTESPWPTPSAEERAQFRPGGGDNVFGIDAQTGEVVWIRSSNAAAFVMLTTSPGSSEGVWAVTGDGQVVKLAGESGLILGSPTKIGQPIVGLAVGSGTEGTFAQLRGGTLVAFGAIPFSEQG